MNLRMVMPPAWLMTRDEAVRQCLDFFFGSQFARAKKQTAEGKTLQSRQTLAKTLFFFVKPLCQACDISLYRRNRVDKGLTFLHGGQMNRKHWHCASTVFASRTIFVTQAFSLRVFLRTLFLLMPLLLVGGAAGAWQGHVVKVLDGDTIEVKNCNDKIVRIHLYAVEAPRISQY